MPDTPKRPPALDHPEAAERSDGDDPTDRRAWLADRLPPSGRVHRGTAQVRLADARPGRRGRFDALARLLQDVAEDDAHDADLGDDIGWILRRTAMTVERFPVLGERLDLVTFCSGTGARWAERTTLLAGEEGARVATRAIWVALDRRSGMPARLDDRFRELYGPSAGDRRVHLRLTLPPPPNGSGATAVRPWPLRTADLDVWGHANNSIAWAAVEEALVDHPPTPLAAVVEHPAAALVPDAEPLLVLDHDQRERHLWLVAGTDGRLLAAARLNRPGEELRTSGRAGALA